MTQQRGGGGGGERVIQAVFDLPKAEHGLLPSNSTRHRSIMQPIVADDSPMGSPRPLGSSANDWCVLDGHSETSAPGELSLLLGVFCMRCPS